MIKRLKNKFVIINMSIATAIAVCVFILTCILTYNSQSSFLLSHLDQAITQVKEQDNTETEENVPLEVPSIYSFCVFVDKDGRVTETTQAGKSISQAHIAALVHEAKTNGCENGYVSDSTLMFLRKDTENGSVFAFASTEAMDATVSYTVALTLILCLFSLLVFLVISDRLARYTVKPVKAAWDSQRHFINDVCLDISVSSASIFTNCEKLILNKKDTVKAHLELVDKTGHEAHRITTLITEISDLAKSKNSHSLALNNINLSKVTEEEISRIGFIADLKKLTLCPSIKNDIFLNTDEEAYLTIVDSLLSSAINYSCQMEKIRISLDEDRRGTYLYVNTPTYIENDVLTHIFECVRGEYPTEEVKYSCGLAVAKNLAISLHGDLKVKSSPLVGTTFMLYIKK